MYENTDVVVEPGGRLLVSLQKQSLCVALAKREGKRLHQPFFLCCAYAKSFFMCVFVQALWLFTAPLRNLV